MENNNYKKWDNIRGEFQDFAASLFGNFIDGYTITESGGIKTFDLLINGTAPLHYLDTTDENKFIWHVPKEWVSGSKVTSVTRDSSGSIQLGGVQLYNLYPGDWVVLRQQAVNGDVGYTDYSIQASKINQYLNIDWNKAAGYPGGISNKPAAEVTGNRTTSINANTDYSTNANKNKYPTVNAVKNYVTSELQSYVPDVSGKEDTINKTNDISSNSTSTTKYPSAKGVYDFVNAAVQNVSVTTVQTISSSSLQTEIPSAIAVYNYVNGLETRMAAI